MSKLLALSTFLYLAYLILEKRKNTENRNRLKHIIHVNGTRGKSTVSRLIDSGLRAGGYKVFTKTTGTSPRIIDVKGEEYELRRRGRPNIKEQIKILNLAAKQKAEVLVIECMAVHPHLQYISQNKILKSDICIVTNVRRDHIDVMGPTLENVAYSMGQIMPTKGVFITADKNFYDLYSKLGKKKETRVLLAKDTIEQSKLTEFKENTAIALETCNLLGIDKHTALKGMESYKRDPGSLKIYKILSDNKTIYFINALAANDPDSTLKVYQKIKRLPFFDPKKLIILVNNRPDRMYRIEQMSEIISKLPSKEIWLTGSHTRLMRRKLRTYKTGEEPIKIIRKIRAENFQQSDANSIIFAIGNTAGQGERIFEIIERIGELIVE